jgi:HSP20 family protein
MSPACQHAIGNGTTGPAPTLIPSAPKGALALRRSIMAHHSLTPFRLGRSLAGGGDPFLSLHREMNRLFDDALRGFDRPAMAGSGMGNFIDASMDVSETENEIRVTAELPGVAESDIDVSLDDDMLTISGEKKFEKKDDKENYHFMERSYGTFQRSLRLPSSVDPDAVKASFRNGVLTVTIPKSAQQSRSHRIAVEGESSENRQAGQQPPSGNGSQGSQSSYRPPDGSSIQPS